GLSVGHLPHRRAQPESAARAYTDREAGGASGVYLAGRFERLGIAESPGPPGEFLLRCRLAHEELRVGRSSGKKRFCLALVKPSHYDDDGYVIQWLRSPIPSTSLAALYGLAQDCAERRVLGPDVEIDVHAFDETNA